MAEINDLMAIRFAQETRDLANLARSLFARAMDYHTRFVAQEADRVVPADDSQIMDSGVAAGSSPIYGRDVHQLLALTAALIGMPSNEDHMTINRIATNMIGG